MSQLIEKVENVFDAFGAMRGGPEAYAKRALLGAAVGYVAMETIRPSFAYYDDGTKRPWAVTTEGVTLDKLTGQQHSTLFPWFTGPVVGAVASSLFI